MLQVTYKSFWVFYLTIEGKIKSVCVNFALCEYGDFSWARKARCSLQVLAGILSTGNTF